MLLCRSVYTFLAAVYDYVWCSSRLLCTLRGILSPSRRQSFICNISPQVLWTKPHETGLTNNNVWLNLHIYTTRFPNLYILHFVKKKLLRGSVTQDLGNKGGTVPHIQRGSWSIPWGDSKSCTRLYPP